MTFENVKIMTFENVNIMTFDNVNIMTFENPQFEQKKVEEHEASVKPG